MRNSVTVQRNIYETVRNLPDKDFNEYMRTFFEYAFYGIEREHGKFTDILFTRAKTQIDEVNQ